MAGMKDLFCVFFYLLICIVVHAVIQEYILDVSLQVKGEKHCHVKDTLILKPFVLTLTVTNFTL